MELDNKKFALVIVSTILLTMSLTVMASYYVLDVTPGRNKHKNPELKANLYVFVDKAEVEYWMGSGNVITNIGENYTRDIHSGNSTGLNGIHWISLGNVTGTLQTKTQLDSEYNRNLGTIVNGTLGADPHFNLTYTHTFNETQRIDGAGAHWEGTYDSNNNLYAVANFAGGAVTFNLNDNCTVLWMITYDAN